MTLSPLCKKGDALALQCKSRCHDLQVCSPGNAGVLLCFIHRKSVCVLWKWALLPSVHQISCWGNTLLLPVSSIYLFPANALVQYTVFSRVSFVILNHLKYMFLKQTTHSYRQCHQGANLTTVPILFWKNFYEDIENAKTRGKGFCQQGSYLYEPLEDNMTQIILPSGK